MINKEKYKAQLRKVVNKFYPNIEDFKKANFKNIKQAIYIEMAEYINKNYRDYFPDVKQLINEHQNLYNQCIMELQKEI